MTVRDLPEPWRGSPYLLGEHARADVRAVWARGDAAVLAVLDAPGRGCGLVGLGDPGLVARLCTRATRTGDPALADVRYATLERGAFGALERDVPASLGLPDHGSSWDWMWTTRALTADAAPARRLPPGPRTAAEVAECLARSHPTASTTPDDERLLGWWGVHQDGRLMAVVGALVHAPGLPPYLVSLGVDPSTRGQGLAGAVMSAAVRDCLDVVPELGGPMVSLGLYASNDVARRVYLRLGFRLAHRFESRRRTPAAGTSA